MAVNKVLIVDSYARCILGFTFKHIKVSRRQIDAGMAQQFLRKVRENCSTKVCLNL